VLFQAGPERRTLPRCPNHPAPMPLLQSRSDRLRHGPSRHILRLLDADENGCRLEGSHGDRPGDWC